MPAAVENDPTRIKRKREKEREESSRHNRRGFVSTLTCPRWWKPCTPAELVNFEQRSCNTCTRVSSRFQLSSSILWKRNRENNALARRMSRGEVLQRNQIWNCQAKVLETNEPSRVATVLLLVLLCCHSTILMKQKRRKNGSFNFGCSLEQLLYFYTRSRISTLGIWLIRQFWL